LSLGRDQFGRNVHTRAPARGEAGSRFVRRQHPMSVGSYDGLFCPDSRWLAYFSYETGRPEVYVVPFLHAAALGMQAGKTE
jgi:hypothetical protein